MKFTDWDYSKRAEHDYYAEIMRVLEKTATASLVDRETFLGLWARQAAERMILGRAVQTAKTWRAAARESMQGRMVYEALERELAGPVGDRVRQLIRENSELIRSLPSKIALEASEQAARRAQQGQRATPSPTSLQHVARWHARMIARTETSKAQSALTEARSEELGLDWYVWQTSRDERVRMSHRKMQGVLVKWDDLPSPERLAGERKPPAPYNSGNIWNCRCYSEPLLRTEQISWPHKVYANGAIRSLTLALFRRMNHLPERETRMGLAA